MTAVGSPTAVPGTRAPGGPLAAFAALTRAGTVVAGTLLCLVGAHLAGFARPGPVVAVAVAVALSIAFAQVVNDVIDVDVDRLHKPHRPLVSGAISVRTATRLAWGLAVSALAAGALAGAGFLAATAGLLAGSWAYSRWWKNSVLAGNVTVATLASTPVLLGAAAAGRVTPVVVAAQAVVLVFMAAFEVAKTGRDRDADAAAGLHTVATVLGVRVTARTAAALCAGFVVAAGLAAVVADRVVPYAAVMGPGAVAPALGAAALLVRPRAAEPFRSPLRLLRLAWFAGIGSLVLL